MLDDRIVHLDRMTDPRTLLIMQIRHLQLQNSNCPFGAQDNDLSSTGFEICSCLNNLLETCYRGGPNTVITGKNFRSSGANRPDGYSPRN